MLEQATYQTYVNILNNELVPALGCTEPIAIALAAAKARQALGVMPERITAACSGNIIKNAKGVIVPTTGNMKGIDTSAVLGAVAGDPALDLEVLSKVGPADLEETRRLLAQGICTVELLDTPARLHILITMSGGGHTALAEIRDEHTNLIRLERDGDVLLQKEEAAVQETPEDNVLDSLNLADILEFANTVNLDDVRPALSRQVEFNTRIAQEGMTHVYGGRVGATLMRHYGGDVRVRARAMAAAGSDARMGGCVLPVVINSGSGNQGITCSVPIVVYAQYLGASEETMYRALVVSNLVALLQKRGIGRLSAFCGAVCAACGSGAGITYLHGGDYETIGRTITNTLANVSGIVCDGAKGSCAAKIAASVDAAILAHEMSMDGNTFGAGEGLVKESVEQTIASIGRMAAEGMRETDAEILKIMIDQGSGC
ncbi:L-serine ammonia-lyase, iron-sulfur-dependent, subunit alpha [Pseudoflavonifractor sp. 524-17]|uniref:L-cysteine desulfidase family protein n=1 Tax=Pseudoflavonifractor sp. 524-17 TaxID=2304577 RepID=UPI00192A2F7D|nr:L-serine ammonia-lyase, iron-sulfur-dependent, subunit alpha [Pseudoflavonifractor sp. 524-17]